MNLTFWFPWSGLECVSHPWEVSVYQEYQK